MNYIERVRRSGGKAPVLGDAKANAEAQVPYTADYIFYSLGASAKPPPETHGK